MRGCPSLSLTPGTAGLQETNKIRLYLKSIGKWRVMSIDDTVRRARARRCGAVRLTRSFASAMRARSFR